MNFKDLSILLVEDNKKIREEILEFLQTQVFHKIYTADNGADGLVLYYDNKPDIILTDLNMPVMDGLEMSGLIKANNSQIPILLITSNFKKEITEKCVDIGIDGYLFKPLSMPRLQKILQKYCTRVLLQKNLHSKHKLLHEYKNAIDVSSTVSKTNPEGMITYVNDAFCKVSGYSKEELLGRNHNIVRAPGTKDSVYKKMWETLKKKQVWQGKIKNKAKNGEIFVDKTTIVPILDEEDKVLEYIAIRQDITDLYKHEEFLKKRVAEEVKKNLSEAKFSTIGKMAAGITHEINTPLTYIKGNLELMAQDIRSLDDSIQTKQYLLEDIDTVLNGVNRIATIVESMREVASQRSDVFLKHNLYSSLITALTISYNKAKQISRIKIIDSFFEIGMDKEKYQYIASFQVQRMEQVFIIIINNALDALLHIDDFEQRELQITIKDEPKAFHIIFLDNAGGIDPAILPNIFEPFQSTKEAGGMGIGLNVAQKIVHDHDGLLLASNVHGGAQFEIVLPKLQR